jgi:hypothetical protein
MLSKSTLKNAVFWDGMANVVPSSPINVILMMEALRPSETSVFTRGTKRNITENNILHSHCRENIKSYKITLFHPSHTMNM